MDEKIEKWLSSGIFPQRVLLSGGGDLLSLAIKIAAQLQVVDETKIKTGICADTLVFRDEGDSFKIGDREQPEKESVRGLIRWSSQKPIRPYRIVILENFERLSREAPHSILKILEEPPERVIFLFTTKNHHQIIDTIISRMTVCRLAHEFEDFLVQETVQKFFQKDDLVWKFKQIEQVVDTSKKEKDKSIIWNFLNDLILHARFFEAYQSHLELLLETQQMLLGNINARLCLERLAIKIARKGAK